MTSKKQLLIDRLEAFSSEFLGHKVKISNAKKYTIKNIEICLSYYKKMLDYKRESDRLKEKNLYNPLFVYHNNPEIERAIELRRKADEIWLTNIKNFKEIPKV